LPLVFIAITTAIATAIATAIITAVTAASATATARVATVRRQSRHSLPPQSPQFAATVAAAAF